jgi:hypothetical protein
MEEFNAMDIDGILAKRARVITTGDVDPKVLLPPLLVTTYTVF